MSMQIELIGCTSAGKSTFTEALIASGSNHGCSVQTSYDYVLKRYGLAWLSPRSIRMLALNGIALVGALIGYSRRPQLFRLIISILYNLPSTISWRERLKIARITSRNLGIHLIVEQAPNDHLILADEGMVQVVHYLFVHLHQRPNFATIDRYLALIPLPELVLYYQQPETVLVERTTRRGHKRIPTQTPGAVEQFIEHAYRVFEHVAASPRIRKRRVILNGQTDTIIECPSTRDEINGDDVGDGTVDAAANFLHLLAQIEQTTQDNKQVAPDSLTTTLSNTDSHPVKECV